MSAQLALIEPAADSDDASLATGDDVQDAYLHDLCIRFAQWMRARRLCDQPSDAPPDAAFDAEMGLLCVAMLAQPRDSLGRAVFEWHYLRGVANVKAAAASLGISRTHWYYLLRQFRRRIHATALEIRQAESFTVFVLSR